MLRKSISTLVVLILLSLVLGALGTAEAQGSHDPTVQTAALLYDEARTVYLGNLARRDNGIPPLRWNRQLTHAARWFSWDSVENRPGGFCGHDDTQGNAPWDRAAIWGYLGFAGAENAFCGYVTPADAINGWMNSPGHRANLLDATWREVGLGYYRRNSDGRGYVAQVFGNDSVYAPVIIENEAVSTASQNVNLYIYDRATGGGFAGLDVATQMMVSNNAQFSGATWEPYNANKAWTLANGNGWRDVYVKTRDKFNRNLTVSDTIYVGANVPLNELGPMQMSTTQSQVGLYNLNSGGLPQAQFSLGWLADDTFGTFGKLWGNGERVNDAAAWGGTAFRLYPGNGEASAWVWDTTFIKDTPLVAYFRLKVSNNTSSSEVARVSVTGGGTEFGPLSLQGTDFTAPNQYQEFALNFTFNSNPNDDFLIFQFWQSGNSDVYIDAVSIFSTPQAITSPLSWSVPGNNYRGQGVWVRYTNGSQFSTISEAQACITCAVVKTLIGGNLTETYLLDPSQSTRDSYFGVNSGPVKVESTNGVPIVAALRDAWMDNGAITSSIQLMGLPETLLSDTYLFPAYNNVSLDDQLRFANVGTLPTTVTVTIGGVVRGTYPLNPSQSVRVNYPGLDSGPVKVKSSGGVKIIASIRDSWHDGTKWSSYAQLMGLPENQLSDTYLFPAYNNVSLDDQLRFGNVGALPTTVTVTIGGVVRGTYDLTPSQSIRVSYIGLDSGPVEVKSSGGVKIIASIRDAWFDGSKWTSYFQLMGLPKGQLSDTYLFPAYDNVSLDGQLRFANVGTAPTTVTVTINGVVRGTYPLNPSQGIRVNYPGLDSGPVEVQSSGGVKIIASLRDSWFDGSNWTSYSQLMGLPATQLSHTYLFPAYNNVTYDNQLRIGVP